MTKHIYEIAVIGGGPVGMFATYYAGLRSADVILLESLDSLGGQTGNLYPAKVLYDIGGFPHIPGEQLVKNLTEQMMHFEPTTELATALEQIVDEGDHFRLETSKGNFWAKTVIVATGGGAFTPRKLAVDYDPAIEGKELQYFVTSLEDYRGLDVAIAGGGDSAIDWSLALQPIAKSVQLIHRRNEFRGLESSVAELRESRVDIHTPFLIQSVEKKGEKLQVHLKMVRGDETPTLSVDKLLVNYGFTSENRILSTWGLEARGGVVHVDSTTATNRPGIFAVGDVADYPGKLKLIASGFGEAPIAVNAALAYLYPERRAALHSSQLYH